MESEELKKHEVKKYLAAPFFSKKGVKGFGHELFNGFMGHDLMTLSGALAFFTALSLAPLVLIMVAVVGLMGEDSQIQLLSQIESLMGEQAATAITSIVNSANDKPELGGFAGKIGGMVLLFAASGVFAQLQSSLNVIWNAEDKVHSGVWGWLRKRLLSMGMVISLGFLAIVSLGASAALSFVFQQQGEVWKFVNTLVSLSVFSLLFGVIFKYLPDVKLSWRNALVGGFATALLFTLGKYMIGFYLGKSAVGSAYGAAGSLIVLLVWVYYSALIVFTGAEITRILASGESNPEAIHARPDEKNYKPHIKQEH